jgi:hypothetical protein
MTPLPTNSWIYFLLNYGIAINFTISYFITLINKCINTSVSVMTMQPDMYNYSVIYTIQIMINS